MILGILSIAIHLVPPLLVIWGWNRWALRPNPHTWASNMSLLGFIAATASAALAVLTIAYAQVHHFPHYDPLLLRIFAWGALLSVAGIVLGIVGIWRPNALRWHARRFRNKHASLLGNDGLGRMNPKPSRRRLTFCARP
jgi:hypothetical protein